MTKTLREKLEDYCEHHVNWERADIIADWWITELTAILESLKGEERNQENKIGTECGACGDSFPTICECSGYNTAVREFNQKVEEAKKGLK